MPIYSWFKDDLRIQTVRGALRPDRVAALVERFLSRSPRNLDRLVSLLAAADVGISGLRVEESQRPLRDRLGRKAG